VGVAVGNAGRLDREGEILLEEVTVAGADREVDRARGGG
jgi:hypothetical protein